MSGSGGGGGYGYQADAFAFVSAHALAEQPLNWFDDVEDVPVVVSMETGGPGNPVQTRSQKGSAIHNANYQAADLARLFRELKQSV